MASEQVIPVNAADTRVIWVDYAKGICIILVVMLHVTYDYSAAVGSAGWLHYLVVFAGPFRMPDFFLLAGLFLSLSINNRLREYLDRKVIHFIYFYFIWLLIQLGVTRSGLLINDPAGFVSAFAYAWLEPFNTLWFVHMLAIFYLVTRLLRDVPGVVVFLAAAVLQTFFRVGWIDTGWSVPNRFFDHYVYFYVGYAAAPWIFSSARQVPKNVALSLAALLVWAVINLMFTLSQTDSGPGISLVLGLSGAAAVVTMASLLAGRRLAGWLRYCGANSIVIYLTFFLPMKVGIRLLSDTGVVPDVGSATLLITFFAVTLPLLFHWIIRDTWLMFLYRRPAAFKLNRLGHMTVK